MSSNYGGLAEDVPVIIIPDDGDVADSESVNRALRGLQNTTRIFADRISTRPIVRDTEISWDNAGQVTIGPYQILARKKSAGPQEYVAIDRPAEAFTYPDLDIKVIATFEVNTVYYCYAEWDTTALAFKRTISKLPPDGRLYAEATNPLRRYLGCFCTGPIAGGQIRVMHKVGQHYYFPNQPELFNASTSAPTTVQLSPYVPAHCRMVLLHLDGTNTATAAEDGLNVTNAFGGVHNMVIPEAPATGKVGRMNAHFPVRITSSRTISVNLTVGAPSGVGVVTLLGFVE